MLIETELGKLSIGDWFYYPYHNLWGYIHESTDTSKDWGWIGVFPQLHAGHDCDGCLTGDLSCSGWYISPCELVQIERFEVAEFDPEVLDDMF